MTIRGTYLSLAAVEGSPGDLLVQFPRTMAEGRRHFLARVLLLGAAEAGEEASAPDAWTVRIRVSPERAASFNPPEPELLK